MSFAPISHIKVSLCFDDEILPVGSLARRTHKIYFEYDSSFIARGLDISPVKCALKPGVQSFDPFLFEGLPGVFNDSLPDGWGRLLLDRYISSMGVMPQELSPLDRLAHVGHTGMGALLYDPDNTSDIPDNKIDIQTLAQHANQVLSGEGSEVLAELLTLNGSSTGTRPKAVIGLHRNKRDIIHGAHKMGNDYQPWLVKFQNINDGEDAGAIEYVYALMAAAAGLTLPAVHLFPAKTGSGYFAVQRFDRKDNKRIHMHTVSGLLHSDFRTPALDYEDLMALTMILTKDIREVEKMYRLAVFNVLTHNRDDHAKNFSYLMDESGKWSLAPAYDLTFSAGLYGEQSTTVMGEGKNPGYVELMQLGLEAKLSAATINAIMEQTRDALSKWSELAGEYGVASANIDLISANITTADI